ncbi:hypothetical protein EYV94_16470 [Puteibacter caeruleilacunae]|nr:hypothetical protein EYV94_16470 [Puteibacter caeruleilacunae]
MQTKIKKGIQYLAAAAFIFALVLNIKVTLDDPFVLMSDAVVAQTTSTGTTSSTDSSSDSSTVSSGSSTSTQILELKWEEKICKNGVNRYEICEYGGDGNSCSTSGQRTRYCPYPGD